MGHRRTLRSPNFAAKKDRKFEGPQNHIPRNFHFFLQLFFLSPNSHLAGPAKTGTKCPSRFAIRDKRSHVLGEAVGHEPTE